MREHVRLLDPTVLHGPREAPSTHVPPGPRAAAAASRTVPGLPSLVVARKGRALGLEGVTPVFPRAARPKDEGRCPTPVIPQLASPLVEKRR